MAQQHGQVAPAGRQSSANYETVFTNAKAGMEGVDAEKVKRVIFEASKGSAHYENERRKERAHEERIARMHAARLQLTPADLARHTAAMDAKLAASEAARDLSRTWLHIDMDAFFAAVEELDRPDLHNRPFAVGGMGMISTANYAARKFGVRSAMPGFLALKLCPDLTFVAPQFGKYRAASERTRAIFRDYDPSLPPLAASLDEASLDVTQHCEQQGVDPDQVAAEIRGRVRRETGLTCSVGIAPNRTLAKICSDANKPDGQFRLPAHRQAVMDFVAALSIRKVPGVGRVTQRLLAALGVHTCADLVTHRGLLQALFSPTACDFFVRVALGLGPTQHTPPPAQGEVGRKGISHERTFRPTSSQEELEGRLGELAAALARDMAGEGLRGRTVTLKLKLSTFELRTRAASVASHISAAADLYAVGRSLLLPELPCELRLLGLRVSSFLEPARREAGQLSIEQMLQRRQQGAGVQQQQQQQAAGQPAGGCVPSPSTRHSRGGDAAQECCEEEEAEVEEGAVEEEEEGEEGLHTSQVLSDGEFLELSLKHWEPPASTQDSAQPNPSLQDWCGNDGGGDSGPPVPAGGCQLPASHGGALPAYSLPPSPLVSPAKAAGGGAGAAAEAEACAGKQVEAAAGAPIPRAAGQQVASRRPGSSGGAGEGAERQREAAEAVVPQQQQEQQAQQMWSCAACTFDNPRTAFWCEMCRSSRLPLKASTVPAAAAAPATKGASGTNAGKAKRGRKSGAAGLAAAATAAAPSILRFMSAAAPQQQQQQQQQQREGSQPQRQQEQQPEPQQQQDQSQQLQQPQPHQPQQPQQPLPAEQAVGSEQAGGPLEESLHQSQAVPVPGAEMQQQWGGEEDGGDGLWGDSDDDDDEPGSPLLPGEDVMECNLCWEWVRETRLQAHMDVHKDQELAQKLQAEEDRLARLFGSNPGTSATPATAGGSGSGKKRQAGGKSGGGGGPGKQATLTAVFSKRAKK